MTNEKKISRVPEWKYHILFGVRKNTFDTLRVILEDAYEKMRKKGGRKRGLSVLDMLVVFLSYYHDYRTMENIAFDYGCHKQRICEAIAWVEATLLQDGRFSLPSKRKLVKNGTELVIAIVDATECETERPKKNSVKVIPGSKNATR